PTIATRGARIEASGAGGGGVVRLGGGRQGAGRLAHAERVTVDAGTVIRADATTKGAGGDVVVWSDVRTQFSGTITARGGREGGNGGEAEVSSKGVLSYDGTTILTAAKGRFGTLLLDPYDVTISTAADANQAGFTATGNDSVIGAATLLTALGSANVTISTGTSGSQAGTITLATGTPLSWNTGATLTLQAAGAVTLNSAVTAQAGGLTIAAATTATATADLSVARFTLASGDWTQNAATLPGFATADFRVTGGSFLRAAGGAGTAASPYRLTDIYGVQGMGTSAVYRAARYGLANDVDASGTVAWNGGLGFVPVGQVAAQWFIGSLDGAGHTITGLTIARPSQSNVGLIGSLGPGGSVSGLGLVGASIAGNDLVGGLVGNNNGGTVSQSYASGSVSGGGDVGGLVGYNDVNGRVSQSYASGSVSGNSSVGGLVGANYGTVSQSYASGSVSGFNSVGGLVGWNRRMVSQSYASGSVSGRSDVGGLVGDNGGYGTVTDGYWDTQTTGRATGVGTGSSTGVTGLTTPQARTASSYVGFDFATVWYQAGDLRPILRSEAAPADANLIFPVSNLHQLQLMDANLTVRYRLTANLDASATNATASSSGVFGAGGFVPVGTDTAPFYSLDGAGHTITGLTITRPSQDNVGLIGSLGGTVTNIGLLGGDVTGFRYVGTLVGSNHGTVNNAYASGSVSGSLVGGLVGSNYGRVSQSYASGSVSGSNVGGLVGFNVGTVSQSYASGSVSGSNVGGLVGYNYSGGTVTNGYWDKETTGQANGVGTGSSAGVTGLTTPQARTALSYAGFDFGTVWYQAGDLRPILRSEAAPADANGIIPVSNLHQLQLMGANLAGRYRLTADLDASATNATDASAGVFGAGGFVPVGSNAARFAGSLDGAGHTIAGLTIARPSQDAVGLIGYLGTGGSVSGLGLVGGSVAGQKYVGGLVGANSGGTVRQSYASGSVSGDYSGGLVGFNYNGGAVRQSYASGRVSGDSSGGLVGANATGTVIQSYASGSVSGSSSGGLVGYNTGTVTTAYWDTQTTGRTNDVGSGSSTGATGLTTVQMQDLASFRATYAGFDFDTVWAPPNQAGQGGQGTAFYPQLYSLSNVVAVTPTSSRTYGSGSAPVATYAGLRPGDFVTTLGTLSTGATQTSDVGSYAVTASGTAVTRPAGNATRILYVPGTLGITPATITVAGATGVTKTYDGSTALPGGSPGFTSSGVLFGDAVTVSAGSALYDNASAGLRSVLVSGLSLGGAKAGNYRLSASTVTGSGTIDRADLGLVGITALGKTYDGTTSATLAGTATVTPIGSDVVAVSGSGTGAFADKNAGTGKPVTVSGYALSGTDAGNYNLVLPTGLTASIARAPLAVTGLSALGKTYDGTTAATLTGTATVTLIGSDVVAVSGSGTGSFADKNAGTGKPVTVSGYTLSGTDAGNYNLVLPTGLTASIARAPLAVTGLSALGKTYDGTTSATLAGIATVTPIGSDVVAVSGSGTGAFADKNAGMGKPVTVSGYTLSGTDAGNYDLVLPTGLTASIAQAPLAVTGLSALDKVYDGTTALPAGASGYTVTGLLAADAGRVAVTSASAAYDAAAAGPRTVQVSGLSLTGAGAGNYVLAATTATGSGTIAPRPVTLAGTRVYDAGTAIAGGLLTAGNLVGADAVTVSGTGTLAARDVGTQALTGLSGLTLSNPNYTLAGATGGVTITPATLTYAADPVRRTYGAANPALTGTITGLLGADTLAEATTGTAAFTTGAGPGSNVGGYAVAGSGLAARNYVFAQAAGNATALGIDPALLAVTGTKTYDATAGFGAGQLTVTGGVTGESVALTTGSATAASAEAGLHASTSLTGLAVAVTGGNGLASNYALPAGAA
ncbi:beta strand repeat-containing protein, partial [Methylobacterium oryzihabitans]